MQAAYNYRVIHSISGKLSVKSGHFAVVDAAGLGLKIFANQRTLNALPAVGSAVKFFVHLHMREDGLELYGFLTEEELSLIHI